MLDRPSARAATAAIVLLLVFPVTVALLQLVQSGAYAPMSMAMSELALGAGGWAMTVAFCSMGAGTLMVSRLVRAQHPRARVTPACLALAGVLDVVSAFFHTTGEGQPDTAASTIHLVAGVSTFLLVIVAMFAAVRPFTRSRDWRAFGWVTLGWAGVAVCTFFLVPALGEDLFGLAQRLFVAVWLAWLVAVAVRTRVLARTSAARAASTMAGVTTA